MVKHTHANEAEETLWEEDLRLHAGKELLICSITSARSELLLWGSSSSSEHMCTHKGAEGFTFLSAATLYMAANSGKYCHSKKWVALLSVFWPCVCVCVCATIRYGSSPEFSVSGPRSCTAGEDAPFTRESTSGWNEEQGKCQNRLILFQLGIWERCMNAAGMYTKRKTQHMTTYAAKYNLFSARFIDISVFL